MSRTAEISPVAAEPVAAPAQPLFVEVRSLWKRAEALSDVQPDTMLFVRNKEGLLVYIESSDLSTERLEAGIAAGHVYILWGHKHLTGEAVDEMCTA